MPDIQPETPRERVIDTMVELTRLDKNHRVVAIGADILHVYLGLHRRGFKRAATTATCRVPCGQYDVGLVVGWQSVQEFDELIARLIHYLHAAATVAVWIDARGRARSGEIQALLEGRGFRIEAGASCGDGFVLSARWRERLADAA